MVNISILMGDLASHLFYLVCIHKPLHSHPMPQLKNHQKPYPVLKYMLIEGSIAALVIIGVSVEVIRRRR